jgi:RNA polymerase sigma-70 factor (ECF subfamily)
VFFDLTMGQAGTLTLPGAFSTAEMATKGKSTGASDEELLQRYRGGDGDAFRVLYGRHREHLYRFVLRLTGNCAEGEEVFQETWMAVIYGRERFRADARFATYLFSIARRRAADRWRKRGTVIFEPLPEIEQPVLDSQLIALYGPLDRAHNAELGTALSDAIDRLPPAQREAFLMQAEGDLSLGEIAQATQTNPETVKSRLRYATRRLRKCLAEWRFPHER